MKIYTKTGDDGTTGLFGGERLSKADARIENVGNVDELNAAIGLAAVAADSSLAGKLRVIQVELFAIGAYVGLPDGAKAPKHLSALDEAMITRLEREIDAAEAELPPLQNFILPGGCECSARLHLARAVCRRAERGLVQFASQHKVQPVILVYFNRLSDWLFVYARHANLKAKMADIPWLPGK